MAGFYIHPHAAGQTVCVHRLGKALFLADMTRHETGLNLTWALKVKKGLLGGLVKHSIRNDNPLLVLGFYEDNYDAQGGVKFGARVDVVNVRDHND